MAMLKSMATVSGFTAMSRVLGFVRDVLVAGFLGKSNASEAWVAAFRFPNMFRRIFGEGAFNAAFVPLFGRELEEKGEKAAVEFANRALTILALVLGIGTLIAIPGMEWIMGVFVAGYKEYPEKFELTVGLTRITFSYLLCMAMSAHLSGVLNTLKIFAMPAFAPVLLNLIFLGGLTIAVPMLGFKEDPNGVSHVLAWCVFAAGWAQLFALWVNCRRSGMAVRLVKPTITPRIKRLFILMLPGIAAAGVQQINLFFGTWIGSREDGANTYIYFSERVYQLPLGMIGIAMGVVLLPEITRKLRGGKENDAWTTLNRGVELALLVTLPAAVAMLIIPEPIIAVLFERKNFSPEATVQTALTLAGFAAGLPGYVLVKVLQPGYFAREDTKRPMYMAAITVVVNIAFSLILFPHFKHVGIAIATAIAAWVNVMLLAFGLRGEVHMDAQLKSRILRIVAASAAMGFAVWGFSQLLDGWVSAGGWLRVLALAVLVAAGMAIYGALALALKATSLRELRSGFSRRS